MFSRAAITSTLAVSALTLATLIAAPASAPAQGTDPTPTVISKLTIAAPGAVAFDPTTNTLVVPGFDDGVVHLVDPATMKEKGQIPTAIPGYGIIQLVPELGRAYLIGTQPILTGIDLAAGSQLVQIPLAPEDVNATGSVLAQADVPLILISFGPGASPGAIALVSTVTNFRRGTIELPFEVGGLALAQSRGVLVVSDPASGTVTFLDTFFTPISQIPVAGTPGQVLSSPDGSKIYVANSATGLINVIDTDAQSQVGVIDVGAGVDKIALSADGSTIAAMNSAAGEVLKIDAASGVVQSRGKVGTSLSGITFGADNRVIYATDKAANTLLTVDLMHVAPASPTTVRVKVREKSATVTWRAPAMQGTGPVIKYRVTTIPKSGTCTSTKRSCTIQGVKPGRTYKFQVVAETAATSSEPTISRAVKIPVKP
jgi:DNA-binding beta-propeller fold protein YncE